MTGAAVAAGASAWWTAAAVATDVAIIAGTSYSAYSSYQQGQEQAKYAKQQAEANAANSNAQAKIAAAQAEIAQAQGNEELAKRKRILSADIGSQYANWAGNGLMVDGAAKDTLGDVLSTTVMEGQTDLNTIKDNTAINVWQYKSAEAIHRANAANGLSLGATQAGIAKSAGTSQSISTGISGATTLGTSGIGAYGSFSKMKTA